MGRKILFVTSDQQRYDTLGCNGGTVARTPVVDGLAAQGYRYERAHPQSVVCMPSRSTIITGQHPSTHGVWMNGVALPVDAPSVATVLHDNGYRTALIGKPHFEPFLDPFARFIENRFAREGLVSLHRGFEHFETATHGALGPLHYARWMAANHPEAVSMFFPVLDLELEVSAVGGGDTGAPQVHDNAIPREWYHTDWVADRTISWLDSLDRDDDWFCWMSFPDPHHPWDPPASEIGRVDWREVPLPAGYIEDTARREAVLDAKPRHWKAWYDGSLVSNYEAPASWVPATLTADQIREVNARNAVECELIDEALARVLAAIAARGWSDDVDVIFTTDHGELQGDFGLLQRSLPRRRADANTADLEARRIRGCCSLDGHAPCRVGRSRSDVLSDCRCRSAGMDGRRGTSGGRLRCRRSRLRTRADGMGQRALRCRCALANHHA
jgi:arylsulfatase A-like enzyme